MNFCKNVYKNFLQNFISLNSKFYWLFRKDKNFFEKKTKTYKKKDKKKFEPNRLSNRAVSLLWSYMFVLLFYCSHIVIGAVDLSISQATPKLWTVGFNPAPDTSLSFSKFIEIQVQHFTLGIFLPHKLWRTGITKFIHKQSFMINQANYHYSSYVNKMGKFKICMTKHHIDSKY